MTPIETALAEITRIRLEDKQLTVSTNRVINLLQSLLPVEQQMMCDVLDWAAHEGFVHVSDEKLNKKYWFKVGSEKEYTTTELLQLFTNKNEGK